MYTKLEISWFRAFKSLTVAPLNRLNLIAGDNNIGKTGILEAIYLAHATDTQRLQALPSLFRRTQDQGANPDRSQDVSDNFWLWLFHKRNVQGQWRITLRAENGGVESEGRLANTSTGGIVDYSATMPPETMLYDFSYGEIGAHPRHDYYRLRGGLTLLGDGSSIPQPIITAISTRFGPPADDAELVNSISVRNEKEELIEYLRLIEPRLTKLEYLRLPGHGSAYVYADLGFGRGKQLIPATQLGQGFARLLSLFATVMVKGTQILLIDEFENGLQHDALVPIWKALDLLARNRGIQVFATTHSYECIQAAHEAASAAPDYDLGVVRLQWTREKEVEAVVLGRENIETALDSRLEVR
ncbi:MAG: hypothetical protein RLZZ15_2210 [Verrucomicrobiota bacterium]|jgi:hypothetical protein